MKRFFGYILFLHMTSGYAETLLLPKAENPQVITLQDAIELGLKRSPELKKSQAELSITQGQKGLSTAPFFPHVSLRGKTSFIDSPFKTYRYPDRQVSLDLNWSLFDFSQILHTKAKSEALLASTNTLNFARLSAIKKVTELYLKALREKALFDGAAMEVSQLAPLRLASEQNLLKAGFTRKIDVNRAEFHFHEARTKMLNKELSYRNSIAQLGKFLGQTTEFSIVMPDIASSYFEEDDGKLLSLAKNRPDVIALKNTIKEQDLIIKKEAWDFLPKLSAQTSLGFFDRPIIDKSPQMKAGASVGLMVEMPLFSGGQSLHKTKIARAEKTIAEINLAEEERRLSLLVAGLKQSITIGAAILENTKAALDSAKDAKESADRMLKENEVTSIEYMEAQLNYFTASNNLLEASLRDVENKIEFLFNIGKIEELSKGNRP